MNTCAVVGCDKHTRIVRGMCLMHYERQRKHGDPSYDYRGRGPAPFRPCREPDCDGTVGLKGARGYCPKHYKRVAKYGTTELPPAYVVPRCAVDDCQTLAKARGLCEKHYQRAMRHGDPLREPTRPLAERLWAAVDRESRQGPKGDCWEWQGWRHPRGGYGYILGSQGKLIRTSRAAWEITNGPISAGLWVCHHCDNPPCVRPDHLFLGTPMDNVRDMIRKGRGWWQDGRPVAVPA